MRLLFVCNQGQYRSRTAAEMFSGSFSTRYAGVSNNLVTEEQIEWADIVFVMEDFQRGEIAKRFPKLYLKKRILCLGIPDIYSYNQPELVELLKEKVNAALSIHQIAF